MPDTTPSIFRRLFDRVFPKAPNFFQLLSEQVAQVGHTAGLLVDFMETGDSTVGARIRQDEHEADHIKVRNLHTLNEAFSTPIDREDILHINKAQEATIDLVHNLSNRFYLLELKHVRFPMVQLARTIKNMVLLTGSMLEGLSQKRDSHNTKEFQFLCGECEMLLSMGIRELYDLDKPTVDSVLDLLKWTRAYDRIEAVVNQVTQLAETIEEAVLKNV